MMWLMMAWNINCDTFAEHLVTSGFQQKDKKFQEPHWKIAARDGLEKMNEVWSIKRQYSWNEFVKFYCKLYINNDIIIDNNVKRVQTYWFAVMKIKEQSRR